MPNTDDDWEGFWRGTREGAAYRAGGPQEEVLARFWADFFLSALSNRETSRLLDIACGNGAVARIALESLPGQAAGRVQICGLDRSASGLIDLTRRQPRVAAIAGDAGRAPFRSAAFDVVASQFGLEYAGPAAFAEAARLLAPGGVFAGICHLAGGALYRECKANLEATQRLLATGILAHAREFFSAEAGPHRGEGYRRQDLTAEKLTSSLGTAGSQLQDYDASVAGGAVFRLFDDLSRMAARPAAFDPAQVVNWIDGMAGEMTAYAGRMGAMIDAALDDSKAEQVCKAMSSGGVSVRACERIHLGEEGKPAAWMLLCDRR